MLVKAGYTITVFMPDDNVADYIIIEETKDISVIKFNSNPNNLNKFLGYTSRLSYAFADIVKRIIEIEGNPTIIESQDYLGIAYYLTQLKHISKDFLVGVPIIITLHSPAFIYLEYNRVSTHRFPDFWTGEMEKQSIAAADGLISPTNFLIEEIEKYISLAGKELAVIANPFEVYELPANNFEPNKIVYYGKLSPQKGSFELLEYFKKLWDNGFKHPLHIIGGVDIVYHPEMQTMGKLVEIKYAFYLQKGLLKLHGKIKPAQISTYISDAHVVIVPSIVDNLPYVVMEVMSMGKIVLASKQGGQREMIEEGISGFLFDHEAPETFANQLNKILLLQKDVVLNIGKNAYESVIKKYSFESLTNKKLLFIDQIKYIKDANYFPFLYQEDIKAVTPIVFEQNLLSIVIPYYNMGKYIEECINSVFDSSYKNIEIIIINDGSTDEFSIQKLILIGKQKNIQIINNVNAGLAATRNFGAEIARGEFLAFLDADDKVSIGYFEKAIYALKKNTNVFFVGCWVKYFENSTAIWPTFTPQPPYALVHNPVNSSGLIYKRNAFLAGGINDKKVDYGMEDYESVINMLDNGFNGIIIPEILFYYRVRTGSMIRNISREKLLYSNKFITEKHKRFYTKFAIQIINLLTANGPGYLFDNPTFEVSVTSIISKESIFIFRLKKFIKRNERLKKIVLLLKK